MKNITLPILLIAFCYIFGKTQDSPLYIYLQMSSPPGDLGYGEQSFANVPNNETRENAISLSLSLEYKMSTSTLRFRLGWEELKTFYDQTQIIDGGNTNTIYNQNSEIKQFRTFIAPGVTWDFISNNKAILGFGFEIPFRKFSDYKSSYKTSSKTINISQMEVLNQYSEKTIVEAPLGFSVGVGAIAKFDYIIYGNFILGAEFCPTLNYIKHNVKDGTRKRYQNGELFSEDSYNGSYEKRFFQENRFSINLGYRF